MPIEPDGELTVRQSPIYAKLFRRLCFAGVMLELVWFCCQPLLGDVAFGILLFGTIFVAIIAFSVVSRQCRCPQCGADIKRDKKFSPSGRFRYTCRSCGVIWESPLVVGPPTSGGRLS